MEKTRISKEELIERINPFYPFTERYLLDAFRAINDQPYPETVTWLQFGELYRNRNTVDEIVDSILSVRHRKTRADAYQEYRSESNKYKGKQGYKRESDKYKGKQRSDLWSVLKKAEDILTGKNITEWESLGISEFGWLDLCCKITRAENEKIGFSNLEDYTGCGQDAIEKMIDEQRALRAVMKAFHDNVEQALNQKNPDDKLFLNSIAKVWGKKAESVLGDYFYEKRKGRHVSIGNIIEKSRSIRKIISTGEFETPNSGTFYTRSLPTYLCVVARVIDHLFSEIPFSAKNVKTEAVSEFEDIVSQIRKFGTTYGIELGLSELLNSSFLESQPNAKGLPDLKTHQ